MIAEKSRGIVDDSCHGCIYLGVTTNTCDYILMESRLRPCPAGKGCTVRRTRKGGGKIKKQKWDTELGRLLWLDGRKDSEIADEFGIATSVVTSYRKRHWEKGSQKPAPRQPVEENILEDAPAKEMEVENMPETLTSETLDVASDSSDVVALGKRIGVLMGQRDAAEKQREHLLDKCDQHLMRIEELEAKLAEKTERLKLAEIQKDVLRKEVETLRAQLDIVYLIFGSRHVAGLREDI